MELEELEPSNLITPYQDLESIKTWAERNGLTCGTVRGWVYRGVLPSVKVGKLRMINAALVRSWLTQQDWNAAPTLHAALLKRSV
ncbi:hypothetical protein [Pseudomonas sp. TTU2014-080ASC]|jgi:excisionase family DNA binding protein|uniref:hypothetical protein n=1 Tax=Pseudomonas sp. TTU2014-080ASC TaxID=1729724 RepID=UPI000718A8A4|nr:hypothetical protein [Pseudomonas sp. TTU2014-080ASC]KRW59945.1 hypothetical protein AO726_14280 [Pseudomonas sp. TTU2014-080ASC]